MKQREAGLAASSTDTERITALNALAWELRTTDLRRALSLSEEAVGLARAAGDPVVLAASLCLLGGCTGLLGRHRESQECLSEALPLSRRIGDRRTEARCLHFIGRVHCLLADHAAAINAVMDSVRIGEEAGDEACLGDGFNLLGVIHFNLCDYGQALHWFTRGLEARERDGDECGVGGSLGNIGAVYSEMGDHTQSLGFHRRSLEHARRLGDLKAEAICLNNLSGDWAELGRHEEALEAGRQAVEMSERLGERSTVAAALTNMGHAHARTERRTEALGYYARALEIVRSLQEEEAVAEVLYYMGVARTKRGELEEARTHLAEAAAIAEAIGARKTAFQAAAGLSEVCKRLGDYAAALGHHETFHRLEKEVFSEEADKRTKSLAIQMEVEHHRREAAALAEANTALQGANARLEGLATTDPLTGLANHRALVVALDAETARCRREGGPCALLFLDIDHFKSINDTYGHPAGDAVLCGFAETVRACLREVDILGRWGGEEFLVLLPGTDASGALQVGERVRAAVAAHPPSGLSWPMTCSVGVAACSPQEAFRDALVAAADQALYAAKQLGRNQVRLSGDPAIQSLSAPLFPGGPARARRGLVTRFSRRPQRRTPGV